MSDTQTVPCPPSLFGLGPFGCGSYSSGCVWPLFVIPACTVPTDPAAGLGGWQAMVMCACTCGPPVWPA